MQEEYRKAEGMHKSQANYYTKGERARAHKEYKNILNRESVPRKDQIYYCVLRTHVHTEKS